MHSNVLIDFGLNLRKIRESKGISQYHLGAICNLDRNYIGMIERGQRNPSLKSIEKLAKGLDVNIYELFKFI